MVPLLRAAIIAVCGLIVAYEGRRLYLISNYSAKKVLKPIPEEPRIDILRRYSEYDVSGHKLRHKPRMVLGRSAPEILEKYGYSAYCKGSGDELVFSMLDFVCDNFRHDSNTGITGSHSLKGVVRSCEQHNMKTNCRGLSLILAELLRMNGVRARHVTCKPFEEPFSDCHVVVDCLMPSGARVMLDPTYRLYLTDDEGRSVSLRDLREGIIAGRSFHPNEGASYNGGGFDLDDYIEYMAKNLVRFNSNYRLDNTDSVFSEVELVPKGYSTVGYPRTVRYTGDPDWFWGLMEER